MASFSCIPSLFLQILLVLGIAIILKTQAQCVIQTLEATPVPSLPSTQVNVSWTCATNNSRFAINYQLTNGDQCGTQGSKTTAPGYFYNDRETYIGPGLYSYWTLLRLNPYSTYTVFAWSRDGEGHIIERSTSVTTAEAAPSGRPVIEYYNASKTQADFLWDEIQCGGRNGEITGYEHWLIDTTTGRTISEAVVTTMMFTDNIGITRSGLRITGLRCATQYTIHSAGKNAEGRGPSASLDFQTQSIAPSSVQNVQAEISTTGDKMTVTWMEPAAGCTVADTYEKTYKVTYEGNTKHQDGCQHFLTTHANEIDSISSLSYEFSVRPYYSYKITVKHTGGPLAEITQDSPELEPSSPPLNIRITGSTDTTRTIT
ncbi:receptor-type tyrosine-protein phosphatase F-like isoform X2 [Amphiura filiformis]|uniref:receptor-type tyrosine-protein phosphatase F-like isoform X2 n=1 Tax=Amphiura filiformis TaxID=82378 RepID=UPI003B21405B